MIQIQFSQGISKVLLQIDICKPLAEKNNILEVMLKNGAQSGYAIYML